jgi:hypothetical protein
VDPSPGSNSPRQHLHRVRCVTPIWNYLDEGWFAGQCLMTL